MAASTEPWLEEPAPARATHVPTGAVVAHSLAVVPELELQPHGCLSLQRVSS